MSGKHKNPRVYVSLPPEVHSVFKEFAIISEKPLATVLASILVESSPIYKDIIDALEESNNHAEEFKKIIKDKLLIKSSDALQQTLDI